MALLLISTVHAGCSGDAGPATPSRRVREFYRALDAQRFGEAHAMLGNTAGVARLLAEYGSIGAWGDRLTKNGIVAHADATERSADGETADVDVVVMFHDGTRRLDRLVLRHDGVSWRIDAGSLPGNELRDAQQ